MKLSVFGYQDVFVYDILFLNDSVNKNFVIFIQHEVLLHLTSIYTLKIPDVKGYMFLSSYREGLVRFVWNYFQVTIFSTNDNIRWGIIRNMIARIRTLFIYSTFHQFLSFLQWCLCNTLDYVWPCSSTVNAMKMGKW